MIDMFAAQDIADDPHHTHETLTQWLARIHGETTADARARLSTMAGVRARLCGESESVSEEGRAAA